MLMSQRANRLEQLGISSDERSSEVDSKVMKIKISSLVPRFLLIPVFGERYPRLRKPFKGNGSWIILDHRPQYLRRNGIHGNKARWAPL